MRHFFRALASLVDDAEFWLSLAGLLLVGVGMAVTLLHAFGVSR